MIQICLFVFWVVFAVLYGGLGSVWSGFGALSMLLKATFNYPNELFGELTGLASKHAVNVLPSDFEGVLLRDGYGQLLERAKRMSKSKVTCGRYVAEQIVEHGKPIPKEFCEVIEKISQKSLAKD